MPTGRYRLRQLPTDSSHAMFYATRFSEHPPHCVAVADGICSIRQGMSVLAVKVHQ